ncbi:D-alanyl-D-alanine carboxypeptidase family protein [Gorillibacterium sp. CAU 1737]|uniref:D-alanyl-D-alanine carboxypeptidase family protein n=1 Tax=Gorillibacterium sp. CAU 1737 TaxID=3140362 RepID=UPI0032616658
MKRWLAVLLIALGIFVLVKECGLSLRLPSFAEPAGTPESLQGLDAGSVFLFDMTDGKVLYERSSHQALPPASLTKMMTEYVLLDKLAAGEIDWSDEVPVSAYAAQVPGAGMGAEEGERWTVRDLFAAMAVHSANDAAVALAEYAAGSEKVFVKNMNEAAQELGLEDTVFYNATGLGQKDIAEVSPEPPGKDNRMSARDAGVLAAALIDTYPELLEVTSELTASLKGGEVVLPTTNEMLPGGRFGFQGNDGLKTGYTTAAKYCFAGTASREGKRLVTVVMGASTPEARFEETRKLLDYGFGVN